MNPIRSSLPSSSWLVATVVPWLTAVIASPGSPRRSSTFRTPVRKPSAGSAGVEGVFVVVVPPVSSSTATTSVKVPPVSMPMRTRRPVMGRNLSGEITAPEAPWDGWIGGPGAVPSVDQVQRGAEDRVDVQPVVAVHAVEVTALPELRDPEVRAADAVHPGQERQRVRVTVQHGDDRRGAVG